VQRSSKIFIHESNLLKKIKVNQRTHLTLIIGFGSGRCIRNSCTGLSAVYVTVDAVVDVAVVGIPVALPVALVPEASLMKVDNDFVVVVLAVSSSRSYECSKT